ncbi:Sodium/hydrogen exchanger family-domain-containing protein [Mycotypha africana]|uniref:Sodium/hydrogen exchanger family-domain-containing protein n=1 Tax=Mycotypha africana TaxID=64632 RepID=UPI0022FFCB2E|nr:Sodium/hydrogen exchanger family-domain-containing protein [Mycotypha africana]KAI8991806.1 Sodium/hydrogen exchanger family-domain-containing protein [Mycotypha africana]
MAVGIELPKHYMRREWLSMFMILIPVMIFMWLISGLFIWWLIPPINYLHALVIAACVCPTDPILANSVVKGRFAEKHVPAHIRNILSAESGANDGMGFPFLFLALFLISEPSVGSAVGKWVYITLLFQIILSCVIGLVVGFVARKILQWSERNRLIDKPSFLCFAIALALFLMSMTGFSGSDDLLACFVAGNAFSWDDWFRQETEEAHFQEVIDMMLNLAVFVYIGAIIPWAEFGNSALGLTPWRLVVIALLILLFRRLPILILLKPVMPAMKTYREAIFSGWFGPMGVGAVFLSEIAKEEMAEIYHESTEKPITLELIGPVVLFIVLASTLVHGTTIPLFKLGRRIRTRTLSIASTRSGADGSQVLRLPKIQFGQQISTRKSTEEDIISGKDEYGRDAEEQQQAMEELRRNTKHLQNVASPVTTESQSIRFVEPVHPRSQSVVTGTATTATTATTTAANEPQGQQSNSNIERNETSVTSFKNWIHRNSITNKDKASDTTVTGGLANGEQSASDKREESGGSNALKNLFRRHHGKSSVDETQQPSTTTAKYNSRTYETLRHMFSHLTHDEGNNPRRPLEEVIEMDTGERLNPRIEVWNEPHHVVIEDKKGDVSQAVIDKANNDNWEEQVVKQIKHLQHQLNEESQQ